MGYSDVSDHYSIRRGICDLRSGYSVSISTRDQARDFKNRQPHLDKVYNCLFGPKRCYVLQKSPNDEATSDKEFSLDERHDYLSRVYTHLGAGVICTGLVAFVLHRSLPANMKSKHKLCGIGFVSSLSTTYFPL